MDRPHAALGAACMHLPPALETARTEASSHRSLAAQVVRAKEARASVCVAVCECVAAGACSRKVAYRAAGVQLMRSPSQGPCCKETKDAQGVPLWCGRERPWVRARRTQVLPLHAPEEAARAGGKA